MTEPTNTPAPGDDGDTVAQVVAALNTHQSAIGHHSTVIDANTTRIATLEQLAVGLTERVARLEGMLEGLAAAGVAAVEGDGIGSAA